MDFLNRSAANQPQGARPATSASAPVQGGNDHKPKKNVTPQPRWVRVILVIMLVSLAIVAISVAWLLQKGTLNETQFVNKKKTQAVFLTNGQVYFGKIESIGQKYVDLQDIYYLNTQQQSAADNKDKATQQTNFSLVKLGCELHGPTDQMVINRDQISFWENLKDDGQVAKAIAQFKQQNPNGQTCKTTSNSTQQSAAEATPPTDKKQ